MNSAIKIMIGIGTPSNKSKIERMFMSPQSTSTYSDETSGQALTQPASILVTVGYHPLNDYDAIPLSAPDGGCETSAECPDQKRYKHP